MKKLKQLRERVREVRWEGLEAEEERRQRKGAKAEEEIRKAVKENERES